MSAEQHESFAEPNVLKDVAAARYCGISVSTLRRRRKKGLRPYPVRIDRSVGYRKSELDGFLDECTDCPDDDQSDDNSEKGKVQ